MVSALLTTHARAEDVPLSGAPANDMEFFLFLADSVLDNGELTTPMDLLEMEVGELVTKEEVDDE